MGNNISKKKRQRLWDMTDGRCWYCGVNLCDLTYNEPNSFCLDHVHPKAEGGSSASSNLRPSCRRCNGQKLKKSVGEYRAWLEWRSVDCEAFTENQIEWLARHGIALPTPSRWIFWGEK